MTYRIRKLTNRGNKTEGHWYVDFSSDWDIMGWWAGPYKTREKARAVVEEDKKRVRKETREFMRGVIRGKRLK